MDSDDLLDCCKKKVSELNRKIVDLECKNFALEKENERLERRINLIEYRPVSRHYNGESEFEHSLFNSVDTYTLEKLYVNLNKHIKREKLKNANPSYIWGMTDVRDWLWSMMDSDSHDWLESKSRKEYYGND